MPPAAVAVAAICFATFVTVVSWKLPRANPPQSPSVMKEVIAYGATFGAATDGGADGGGDGGADGGATAQSSSLGLSDL